MSNKQEHFKKYFFTSMASTALIIFFITGTIVVEKNAKKVISPNDPPFFSYKIEGHIPKMVKFHFWGKDFVFCLGN